MLSIDTDKTIVAPVVIDKTFFSDATNRAIKAACINYPHLGYELIAIGFDVAFENGTPLPLYMIQALVRTADGPYKAINLTDLMSEPQVQAVFVEMTKDSSLFIGELEHLIMNVPLSMEGKYLRVWHCGTLSVLHMEYPEGWILDEIDDIIASPDEYENRLRVCTLCVPEGGTLTSHEKVQEIKKCTEDWERFSKAWPMIMGEAQPLIHTKDPDLGTYPAGEWSDSL